MYHSLAFARGAPTAVEVVETFRYFSDLDAASLSHYTLENEVLLSGDFDIQLTAQTTSTSDIIALSGGTGGTGLELYKNSSGILSVYYGGVSLGGGGSLDVGDGLLHAIELQRRGTNVDVIVDGNTLGSVTISGSCRVKTLGRRDGGAFYWTGVLSDFLIRDLTLPVGQQETEFSLGNDTTSNIEESADVTYGTELVTNNTFTDTSDWLSPRSNSTLTVVGDAIRSTSNSTGTFGISTPLGVLSSGVPYKVQVTIRHNSSGNFRFRLDDTFSLSAALYEEANIVSGTTLEFIFTGTGANTWLGMINTGHASGDWVEIVEGVTVTELLTGNLVNYVSIPSRVEYVQQGNDWIGTTELWDHNNVVGLTGDWLSTQEQVYELNGAAGTLLKPSSASIVEYIRTTFNYTATAGALRVGDSGIQTIGTSGFYSIDGYDVTSFGFKGNSGSVIGTLSSVSVKRLLKGVSLPNTQGGVFGTLTYFNTLEAI
jgi:hypothetical protein